MKISTNKIKNLFLFLYNNYMVSASTIEKSLIIIVLIIAVAIVYHFHRKKYNQMEQFETSPIDVSNNKPVLMLFFSHFCARSRAFLPVMDTRASILSLTDNLRPSLGHVGASFRSSAWMWTVAEAFSFTPDRPSGPSSSTDTVKKYSVGACTPS